MRHTDCAIFGNWKLSWQNVNTYNNISGSCLKSGKHMWISGRVTEEASVSPEFNPGWEHQVIQKQLFIWHKMVDKQLQWKEIHEKKTLKM